MTVRFQLLLCALVAFANSANEGTLLAQDAEKNARTKLDELLVERRDTLLERIKAVEEKYRAGKAGVEVVISARDDLLDSELPLVSSKQARIEVFEKRLENFRELEEVMKRGVDSGVAEFDDMLLTKAERLRAEIDLLKEQARED